MSRSNPINSMHLVGLCLAAFAAQFFVSWFQPSTGYFWHTDSPVYWDNARSLLYDGRIANTFFPMGASMLLAPFRWAGLEPFSIVLWVHPLLNSLDVLMAFFLVRYLAGPGAAFAAGWCIALYPPMLNYSRQFLSEPWYVFILLAACSVLIKPGRGRAWWGGVLLGFSVLIRTPSLGVAALCLIALAFMNRGALECMLCTAGLVVVLMFGSALASLSSERFVFLTTQGSMATSRRSVLGGEIAVPDAAQHPSYLSALVAEPTDFIKQRLYSFINVASPWAFGDGRSIQVKLMIFVPDFLILIATLVALREALRMQRNPEVILLLCPALGLIGFYTMFVGQNRYRMPYMPFLICFCAVHLWPHFTTRFRRSA